MQGLGFMVLGCGVDALQDSPGLIGSVADEAEALAARLQRLAQVSWKCYFRFVGEIVCFLEVCVLSISFLVSVWAKGLVPGFGFCFLSLPWSSF